MKYARSAIVVLMLTLAALVRAGPQQRDGAPAVGDGQIAGVVMHAGTNPTPVRRAIVSISGGGLASARSAITDDAGRFSFVQLPAGTFRVVVRKPAYLEAAFGSSRPGQDGSAIALAAGERADIVIRMFKGAAIAGVVRDAVGRPLASVQVSVVDLRRRAQSILGSQFGEPFTTDDRGAYRIYGLLPGEYLVAAVTEPAGTGPISMWSAADMDALLAGLVQLQKNASLGVSFRPTPAAPARLAPIFHPATAYSSEAARIRVDAGDERDGIDISVTPVRAAAIEGTVTGGVSNLADVEVGLIAFGPRFSSQYVGIATSRPDATGAFAFRNLPPGRYRVLARAKAGPVNPDDVVTQRFTGGGSAGGVRTIAPTTVYVGEQLFGSTDVEMRGQDVGVSLSLQPGGSIAGRVVFAGATPPKIEDLSAVRIGMTAGTESVFDDSRLVAGTSVENVPTISPKPDGTFQVNGIAPMRYQLYARPPAQLSSAWTLRSAVVDGRDLLDETLDGANLRVSGVTLTFGDTPTRLSGTLQSASGQPAAEYFVVVFAADRRFWREGSRRSVAVRPSSAGQFTFPNLPAGDYFLAALTDVDASEWQRPEFLEQIAPSAIAVTLAWGDSRVQHIRIR